MTRNNQQVEFAGGWRQLQHAKHLQTTPSDITNVRGLDFKPDGSLLYTVNINKPPTPLPHLEITEYDVPTPWDSSTASKNGNVFSIAFLGGEPMSVCWSNDGLHCYYTTASPNVIFQLDATTPHNTSTLSFNGVFFNLIEEVTDAQNSFILPDEKKFYVLYASIFAGPTGIIHQYDMPSKGDLANSVYSGNFKDIQPILGVNLRVFSVDPGARYVYIYERNASIIHRFDFRVIKDISSIVITPDELDVSDKEGLVIGMFIRPNDGEKLYITGILQDNFDEFDMLLATNNSIINNDGDEFVNENGEALVSS